MTEEISREDLDEMLKAEGGIEGIKKSLEQFRKDNVFFDEHCEKWRQQYPDQWAAVYQEKMVAVADDFLKLLEILDEKEEVLRRKCVIHCLSTKKIPWILFTHRAGEAISPAF